MNSPFLSGSSSHQMLCTTLAHTPNKMNKRFYTVPLPQKYPQKTIMYKYMYQNTKPRSTYILTIFSTVKNPLAVRPPSMQETPFSNRSRKSSLSSFISSRIVRHSAPNRFRRLTAWMAEHAFLSSCKNITHTFIVLYLQ